MSLADPRVRLALGVAAVVLVLDLATKAVVERTIPLHATIPLTPFFALTHVRNTGAAFGILGAAPTALRVPLFLGVTIAAVAALLAFLRDTAPDRRWTIAALGGVLGGAAGNFVDRVRYGEVVDFLLLHWHGLEWPAFNVADSAITVGAVAILLRSMTAGREDGR